MQQTAHTHRHRGMNPAREAQPENADKIQESGQHILCVCGEGASWGAFSNVNIALLNMLAPMPSMWESLPLDPPRCPQGTSEVSLRS